MLKTEETGFMNLVKRCVTDDGKGYKCWQLNTEYGYPVCRADIPYELAKTQYFNKEVFPKVERLSRENGIRVVVNLESSSVVFTLADNKN